MAKPKFKFRFKFLQDASEERAPTDPKKSGFVIVPIPAGTERIGTAASLGFWEARGVRIEVLEKIEQDVKDPVQVPTGAFGVPLVGNPVPQVPPMGKRALAGVLTKIEDALKAGDLAAAVGELNGLSAEEIKDPLEELPDDQAQVLFAAIEDAKQRAELSVNVEELLEAVDWARYYLMPPSRRPKRQ